MVSICLLVKHGSALTSPGQSFSRRQIHLGVEGAARRIVDYAVGDAVEGVTLIEHGSLEHLYLREAVQAAVAIGVKRESAREFVLVDPLKQPDVVRILPLIVVHRRAG